MAMANILSQDSWCVTLTKDKSEYSWPEKNVGDDDVMHHLMIEQAVLGLNTKDTCMVEATMTMVDGTERKSMIAHLIPKMVVQTTLTLSFKKVKLRLASGSGPVYLNGTHSQEVQDVESEGESEDGEPIPVLIDGEAEEGEESSAGEEVDEDKLLEELAAAQASKLKEFSKKRSKKVQPVIQDEDEEEEVVKEEEEMEVKDKEVEVKEAEDDEEDEDDDEEEESDDEMEPTAEANGLEPKLVEVGKTAVVEEKEDDEDDEDDDEDDDDLSSDEEEEEEDSDEEEEDDDESEESEEEEAAPVVPVAKKRKAEAVKVANTDKATKTIPVPKSASTPASKKAKKDPATPALSINELKKKLITSANLPKKYDKFVNLMKNAHKITDEKEIKGTWEYIQKNKK